MYAVLQSELIMLSQELSKRQTLNVSGSQWKAAWLQSDASAFWSREIAFQGETFACQNNDPNLIHSNLPWIVIDSTASH